MVCEVAPEATEAYDKRRGTLPPNALGRLLLPEPDPSVILIPGPQMQRKRGACRRVHEESGRLGGFG